MRLVLAGVGRVKAGPERELFARYLSRAQAIARSAGIANVDSLEVDEARGRAAKQRMSEESAVLRARVPEGAFVIALDERGACVTSTTLAATIGRARDAARPALVFVVGGPDGLDEGFRTSAAMSFAFGAATLPHQLVRVLLAEQIYRALTILTGHPYHRA